MAHIKMRSWAWSSRSAAIALRRPLDECTRAKLHGLLDADGGGGHTRLKFAASTTIAFIAIEGRPAGKLTQDVPWPSER